MPGAATAAWRRGRSLIVMIMVVGLAAVSGCGSTASNAPDVAGLPPDGPLAQRLAEEVGESGAFVHLEALQRIADQHGGNRAGVSPGYEASVDYVVETMEAAGWQVDDAAVIASALRGRGVTFERYPFLQQDADDLWTAPGGARVAWFKDPDGNLLSITDGGTSR